MRSPVPKNRDVTHPLNFDGGRTEPSWNDNGCVILKHVTEIGASGDTPVVFTYFSLYMHLAEIHAAVQVGRRIYRKDLLGRAGEIGNATGSLHLEICCDPANAQILIGRAPAWVDVEGNPTPATAGRKDVVFGETFFYLPSYTATRSTPAAFHLREIGAEPALLNAAQWVGIRLEQGDAVVRGIDLLGGAIGEPITDAGFEYHLYTEATKRHETVARMAGENASSPSGWYELLRFGRNLGGDPLPPNATHWRRVPTPRGNIWVDLNAIGVKVFSDADFLPMTGWNCYEMEIGQIAILCQNTRLKLLAMDSRDRTDEQRFSQKSLAARLGEPEVMKKMRRTICNTAPEWDVETTEAQNRFLYDDLDQQVDRINGKEKPTWIEPFKAHCLALAVPNLPAEYKAATWRFHPAEFIATMRKCGWLSPSELAQCIPRRSCKYVLTPLQVVGVTVSYTLAIRRISPYSNHLNRAFRKFGLTGPVRLSHFLGQVYIETDLVRTMTEIGQGRLSKKGQWPSAAMEFYTVFYGRGMMQLTWPANYEGYLRFRSSLSLNNSSTYADEWRRITSTSEHYWAHPNDGGKRKSWAPRYDPDIIANNPHNACDSAGWYWVSKNIGKGNVNINSICDRGINETAIGHVSVLVNGGGYGYFERQGYSMYVAQQLNDSPVRIGEQIVPLSRGSHHVDVKIDFEHQRL